MANYSGNDNGVCLQDEVNYPLGSLVTPLKGFIEFVYRLHYDNTERLEIIYILNTLCKLSNRRNCNKH